MEAVALESGPVEVSRLPQVHLHAVDDLVQPLSGYVEGFEMRLERSRDGMLRLAGEKIRHLVAPPGQLCSSNLRIEAFVDDVVDFAAEGIERRDRAPALRGQEEKGVVEA